jgi:hypothetical protein
MEVCLRPRPRLLDRHPPPTPLTPGFLFTVCVPVPPPSPSRPLPRLPPPLPCLLPLLAPVLLHPLPSALICPSPTSPPSPGIRPAWRRRLRHRRGRLRRQVLPGTVRSNPHLQRGRALAWSRYRTGEPRLPPVLFWQCARPTAPALLFSKATHNRTVEELSRDPALFFPGRAALVLFWNPR